MEWEKVEPNLYRTKVPDGWLVKQISIDFFNQSEEYNEIISICFVPDVRRDWKIDKNNGA